MPSLDFYSLGSIPCKILWIDRESCIFRVFSVQPPFLFHHNRYVEIKRVVYMIRLLSTVYRSLKMPSDHGSIIWIFKPKYIYNKGKKQKERDIGLS